MIRRRGLNPASDPSVPFTTRQTRHSLTSTCAIFYPSTPKSAQSRWRASSDNGAPPLFVPRNVRQTLSMMNVLPCVRLRVSLPIRTRWVITYDKIMTHKLWVITVIIMQAIFNIYFCLGWFLLFIRLFLGLCVSPRIVLRFSVISRADLFPICETENFLLKNSLHKGCYFFSTWFQALLNTKVHVWRWKNVLVSTRTKFMNPRTAFVLGMTLIIFFHA